MRLNIDGCVGCGFCYLIWRGMKYTGSVSLFSYLQAVGVINSHTKDCFCYREIMGDHTGETG